MQCTHSAMCTQTVHAPRPALSPPPRPFGNAVYAVWCTAVQFMYAHDPDDKDDDEIQNQSAVTESESESE